MQLDARVFLGQREKYHPLAFTFGNVTPRYQPGVVYGDALASCQVIPAAAFLHHFPAAGEVGHAFRSGEVEMQLDARVPLGHIENYHLLDFTFGKVNPHHQPGNVYGNVVGTFQVFPIAAFYIISLLLVGMAVLSGWVR
jgi:hypothetical protein